MYNFNHYGEYVIPYVLMIRAMVILVNLDMSLHYIYSGNW